jgi:hypothetical protein
MRSYLPLLLSMMLLAGLAFCSACTSQPAANQTPQQDLSPKADAGLMPLNMSQGSEFVSFEEARATIGGRNLHSVTPDDTKIRIFFIQGVGLNDAGNAQRWVFGIQNGEVNELRVYDHTGWTVISYGGSLPSREIDPNAVISPGRLFSDNHAAILGETPIPAEHRDLDLRNSNYKIAIASGSTSRILIFNATSGETVEAND